VTNTLLKLLSHVSKHLDEKGGSLTIKNFSKYLAYFRELNSIYLRMILGTLNLPMSSKHFGHIASYGSKHLDQKGGSLTVKNSSKYLANLWELIPINLSMI